MNYSADRLVGEHISAVAAKMCTAARTAPKAKGFDGIETFFLTGEDRFALADEIEKIGTENDKDFFLRDAECIRNSGGVVLIGAKTGARGIVPCGLCGFDNCQGMLEAQGRCALAITDLGIAVGSAISVASDERMDNRVFYTAGIAALRLGLFSEKITIAYGIPLSVSSKNIFFDR